MIVSAQPQPLPTLGIDGPRLDPTTCIEPGTGLAKVIACIPAVIGVLVVVLVTYGVALLVFLFSPLWLGRKNRKAMALIRGSGVHLGPDQLPEIHRCVQLFSERLGLQQPPEVYLVEASVINAAAVRLGKRQTILLTDDLIDACLRSHRPECLAYVIGHELAHIALGHNHAVRGFLRTSSKRLARLDEHTCDTVAARLVGERAVAVAGLIALVTGPQVLPHINVEALLRQAAEVAKDPDSAAAEKTQTHPLLLNRLGRLRELSDLR